MEDDILIDNYLKRLLSENEQKSFLERLKSDIEFKEKFELEKQLFDTLNEDRWSFTERENAEVKDYVKFLESNDLKTLKKTLTETNSEFNSKSNKVNRRLFYYIAAASIIVFFGFQFLFNQNGSNQDLYNDYIKLNDLPSFVSRSDDSNKLTKAQSLFENKDYEEALTIFQSYSIDSNKRGLIYIYEGLSQIELTKYRQAEKTFNLLINSNSVDAEKGYWYKALLYLKEDRIEEAKSILSEIISKSLYNREEAKQLIDKL